MTKHQRVNAMIVGRQAVSMVSTYATCKWSAWDVREESYAWSKNDSVSSGGSIGSYLSDSWGVVGMSSRSWETR